MTWTQSNITTVSFYSVFYGNGMWVAGAVSNWVSDTTAYTYYRYRADITCTGVTTDHMPIVVLGTSDQESGHYIGAKTSTNTVSIYATNPPSSTLTIPLIMAIKKVQ